MPDQLIYHLWATIERFYFLAVLDFFVSLICLILYAISNEGNHRNCKKLKSFDCIPQTYNLMKKPGKIIFF